MIKLVIFDLDGTLLNTIDDLAAAGNHVCAAHGWPTHTSEQFRYFVGDGVYKLIERMTPAGAAETPETVRSYTLPTVFLWHCLQFPIASV